MRRITFGLIAVIIVLSCFSLIGCNKSTVQIENLTLYEIDIDFNVGDMTATVSQRVTYYNSTGNDLNMLAFHLHPDAFSQESVNLPVTERHKQSAYYKGLSYGEIVINRAETHDKSLAFREDNQMLYVDIPTLKPNENITVFLRYKIILPAINHRYGYNPNTINLSNFYPHLAVYEDNEFRTDIYYSIGDPFYSVIADYKVKLKVDKNYKVASTGRIIVESANVNTKTLTIEAEKVRDFAIVMSDKFNIVSDTVGNIDINYFYYGDKYPEVSLETACSAIRVFQDIIGDYPYDSYSVVETEFVYGGMEYPQLVLIASDLSDVTRQKVIVHETAHQWWYGLVGNDSIRSSWMDEGLTEFTTALYYREIGMPEIMRELVNDSFNSYILYTDVRLTVQIGSNTSMNRDLSEFTNEYEYVTMVYTKGMLLFNTIYEIIGRDDFVKAMRRYYKKYCYQIATEEQLIREFNSVSNKHIDKVFDAWITGKVVLTTYKL